MALIYVTSTLILAGLLSTVIGRCVGCNDPSRIVYDKAVCHLLSDSSSPVNRIEGIVNFKQAKQCYNNTLVHVDVTITGLPPASNGRIRHHGFHIHEFGSLTNGCRSMGGHYNPHLAHHGSPSDPPSERHVGDLGNVISDVSGNVRMDYYAPATLTLRGDMTIIGRGIVLHEDRDDLGRGLDLGSVLTGNAGRRIACCIIIESL